MRAQSVYCYTHYEIRRRRPTDNIITICFFEFFFLRFCFIRAKLRALSANFHFQLLLKSVVFFKDIEAILEWQHKHTRIASHTNSQLNDFFLIFCCCFLFSRIFSIVESINNKKCHQIWTNVETKEKSNYGK